MNKSLSVACRCAYHVGVTTLQLVVLSYVELYTVRSNYVETSSTCLWCAWLQFVLAAALSSAGTLAWPLKPCAAKQLGHNGSQRAFVWYAFVLAPWRAFVQALRLQKTTQQLWTEHVCVLDVRKSFSTQTSVMARHEPLVALHMPGCDLPVVVSATMECCIHTGDKPV
jgi:hypothetical protein